MASAALRSPTPTRRILGRRDKYRDTHRVARPSKAWILHAAWSVLVAGVAVAILLSAALSKPEPGQCEGIGWGCSLYGGDAAAFDAIVVVPIALAALAVGNVAISVVAWLVRRSNRARIP